MAILSPSILAADLLNLGRDVKMIEDSGCKWVHVDVMDGIFVPNLSYGYTTVKALRPATDMVLDVHLMIDRPIRYVDEFCKAGADVLTIHVESDTPENTMAALEKIAANGVKPGIVLKPKTPAEAATPFLSKCDLVLVMTVEPGFGGQKFMADMMPKVKQLRTMLDQVNPGCHLEVDGGVDLSNRDLCVESGADVLVAGSSFFKAADKAAFATAME
jgi:ribulose-phosphate 3-epimerase